LAAVPKPNREFKIFGGFLGGAKRVIKGRALGDWVGRAPPEGAPRKKKTRVFVEFFGENHVGAKSRPGGRPLFQKGTPGGSGLGHLFMGGKYHTGV